MEIKLWPSQFLNSGCYVPLTSQACFSRCVVQVAKDVSSASRVTGKRLLELLCCLRFNAVAISQRVSCRDSEATRSAAVQQQLEVVEQVIYPKASSLISELSLGYPSWRSYYAFLSRTPFVSSAPDPLFVLPTDP